MPPPHNPQHTDTFPLLFIQAHMKSELSGWTRFFLSLYLFYPEKKTRLRVESVILEAQLYRTENKDFPSLTWKRLELRSRECKEAFPRDYKQIFSLFSGRLLHKALLPLSCLIMKDFNWLLWHCGRFGGGQWYVMEAQFWFSICTTCSWLGGKVLEVFSGWFHVSMQALGSGWIWRDGISPMQIWMEKIVLLGDKPSLGLFFSCVGVWLNVWVGLAFLSCYMGWRCLQTALALLA